jgi:hypothetical protein
MPIRPGTLKQHGSPFVISNPSQRLVESVIQLRQRGIFLNAAYFVVQDDSGALRVAPALDVATWLAALGPVAIDYPMNTLPLTVPTRVEQVAIPKSGMEVVTWLANQPGATVVVLDGQRVMGVLANHNRSADSNTNRTILNALHGPLANLADDLRLVLSTDVDPPQCPNCQETTFFKYDTTQGTFYCPACNTTLEPS